MSPRKCCHESNIQLLSLNNSLYLFLEINLRGLVPTPCSRSQLRWLLFHRNGYILVTTNDQIPFDIQLPGHHLQTSLPLLPKVVQCVGESEVHNRRTSHTARNEHHIKLPADILKHHGSDLRPHYVYKAVKRQRDMLPLCLADELERSHLPGDTQLVTMYQNDQIHIFLRRSIQDHRGRYRKARCKCTERRLRLLDLTYS